MNICAFIYQTNWHDTQRGLLQPKKYQDFTFLTFFKLWAGSAVCWGCGVCGPASLVLVGVSLPHPLMLPGARQPSLHQTIVSSVQIKFNELRDYILRFTSRKKNIFVIFCVFCIIIKTSFIFYSSAVCNLYVFFISALIVLMAHHLSNISRTQLR